MANTTSKKPNNQKAQRNVSSTKAKEKKNIKNEETAMLNHQTYALIIGAIGLFLLFIDFIKGESVWLFLHNSMFGLFGFCAYIVPFILFYVTFVFAVDKKMTTLAGNLISTGILTVLFCGIIHIFSNVSDYFSESLVLQITDAWDKGGDTLASGGIIGAIFGGILGKCFGKAGAIITLLLLIFVVIMIFTGTTLRTLFGGIRKLAKGFGNFTNEKIEQTGEMIEQIKEEKEEKKAFRPPQLPTVSADDIPVPLAEPDPIPKLSFEASIPDIPITSPNNSENVEDVVNEIMSTPSKTKKRARKEPSAPSGEPIKAEDTPVENGSYVFPPIDCLKFAKNDGSVDSMEEMQMGARKLVSTLESFKINVEVSNICRGPSVTRYELVPEAGVRISKITTLSDDLALRLAAKSIRIEAPIPGKSAIGIEVPNNAKSMVSMREIIDTDQFRSANSKLNVALGKDITGNIICADLAKMPHLLVAGTTGSGKSVCLNSMIISILYNATPEEVKLLMIDPKAVEFTIYNGIAHLEVPVVSQPRKAAGALSWAVGEMERRYQQLAENSVRDIKGYNALCETREDLKKMHHIVIFIDELADLMMTSPKEVEDSICRLAQKARAAGIHLVIATQRPSVDVITGIIKANIPSRIALFVSSQIDSRTILDASGAEKLLGNGDMLFSPVGSSKPTRVQGCFISDQEVESVVNHIKSQMQSTYNEETMKEIEAKAAASENANKGGNDDDDEDGDWDPVLNEAAEIVINAGGASTTMLQKKLKLGYARASRVIDQLEEKGIIGPSNGAKPRDVLISKQQWYEMQALADGANANETLAAPDIDSMFADDDDFAGSDDYDEDTDF